MAERPDLVVSGSGVGEINLGVAGLRGVLLGTGIRQQLPGPGGMGHYGDSDAPDPLMEALRNQKQ